MPDQNRKLPLSHPTRVGQSPGLLTWLTVPKSLFKPSYRTLGVNTLLQWPIGRQEVSTSPAAIFYELTFCLLSLYEHTQYCFGSE